MWTSVYTRVSFYETSNDDVILKIFNEKLTMRKDKEYKARELLQAFPN